MSTSVTETLQKQFGLGGDIQKLLRHRTTKTLSFRFRWVNTILGGRIELLFVNISMISPLSPLSGIKCAALVHSVAQYFQGI